MFLGQFRHNLDAKGRLTLPARYRDQLSAGMVLTRGFDRCLLVYPLAGWMPLADRVSALSISDPNVRKLRRVMFSQAIDAQLDRQGRVLIPANLKSHSYIDREAVLVGMHNFIEIWSPDEWESQNDSLDQETPIIAERLAELI